MKKKLSLNRLIYYILFGFILFIVAQLMNSFYTSFKVDQHNKFSNDAIEVYEQATAVPMTVEEFILHELAQEEVALWQEIETYTGQPYHEFFQVKNDFKSYEFNQKKFKATVSTALAESSVKLVQEVMADFGIDPTQISLEAGKHTQMNSAVLEINEDRHLSWEPIQAQAIIGHELIHYLQDDCFFRIALYSFLIKSGENPADWDYEHPFNKLSRFQELRADIIASFKDLSYAKGLMECFEIMLNKNGDRGNLSHPKTSYRLEKIRQIYQAMQLEQLLNV